MFVEKRKFKNSKGLTISAIYEGEEKDAPVVVLCHGFGSSKDNKSTKLLAQKLVKQELSVYRFDFTGCGQSEGKIENDLTPQQGLEDLESAISDLSRDKFALYGSSYGGYISLIYSTKNPVLALGLKAPVSDYAAVLHLKGNDKEERAKGFKEQAGKINIYKDAKNITAPVLIIHGGADNVVPLAQSEKLLKNLGGEKRLAVLHNATHDITSGPELEETTNLLTEFFAEKLH